nr:immunoglobulin light chain junction region [Macaca mulatta]MOX78643.1 immunoglobulin light chain junction region [Macaca mulatta]MOX78852.1 immunoglobulin light chain junction region [Macaca mulatta]MOX79020.1 immunoglobulin light chain junction region [Macaca mulatta]MOX79160.1 immunoglobulin light chain junction region [Macaca mulatta]
DFYCMLHMNTGICLF